tara:strand:+ start:132 stop:350 length:219 start_codon:yes stop_codon:yes gene_type:complete
MIPKINLVLIGGLLPLGLLIIILKLVVWISATNSERIYVKKELLRTRVPFVENPYADVDEKEEEYGYRTDYR